MPSCEEQEEESASEGRSENNSNRMTQTAQRDGILKMEKVEQLVGFLTLVGNDLIQLMRP